MFFINQTKEENDIKVKVAIAFHCLLLASFEWRPRVSRLSFVRLVAQEVVGLEKPFLEEEVFGALLGFSGGNSLGPDGFSMHGIS